MKTEQSRIPSEILAAFHCMADMYSFAVHWWLLPAHTSRQPPTFTAHCQLASWQPAGGLAEMNSTRKIIVLCQSCAKVVSALCQHCLRAVSVLCQSNQCVSCVCKQRQRCVRAALALCQSRVSTLSALCQHCMRAVSELCQCCVASEGQKWMVCGVMFAFRGGI